MFIYTLLGLTSFKKLLSIQSLGLKVNCIGVNHGNGYELFLNLSFHAFLMTCKKCDCYLGDQSCWANVWKNEMIIRLINYDLNTLTPMS
jgi:hypothetical protein